MSNELVPSPDDPNRCQRLTPQGQCKVASLEGSTFCGRHGGRPAARRASKRQMLLDQVRIQHKLDEADSNDTILSLKEEVSIIRMLIDARLNAALVGDEDLLRHTPALQQLLLTSEKLVLSCAKLEKSLNQLLSKEVVFEIVRQFVDILTEELRVSKIDDYEEIVMRVTEQMAQLVAGAHNPEE